MKYLLGICLSVLLFACGEAEEVQGDKLARVGEEILYANDISDLIPQQVSDEDSAIFVHQYIDSWIREQTILQKAKQELPAEKLNVDRQLKDYETSLILYAYEKELIRKKLDTLVSMEEIENYYQANQENFKLQDYIVKVLYLKVGIDAPKVDEVRSWYKLRSEEDRINIENYAPVYSANYYYSAEKWVYFDDVLKVIPLTDINKSSFIRNKQKVAFQEDEYLYFLNVLDYKLKDAVSPLSLEKDKIKSIILNIRATELKKKIREDLYNEAKQKQDIETY